MQNGIKGQQQVIVRKCCSPFPLDVFGRMSLEKDRSIFILRVGKTLSPHRINVTCTIVILDP